jgi:hypothetical protein
MKTPCMTHVYEAIVLRTIAGPFRGYRCVSCGHVTDVDPQVAKACECSSLPCICKPDTWKDAQ